MTDIKLEELNTYDGVLFAATNHLENLDSAMGRRFLMKVNFPLPAPAVRSKIWKAKMPFLTEDQAETIAGRFPNSGGLVDNVASICLLEKVI